MKIKNFQDKLQLLRDVFLDVLDQNFLARCYFIKPYVLCKTGSVVTVLTETDFTFDEDPNALKLPIVSLHGDFLILENFIAKNSDKISPATLLTENPFGVAYIRLLQAGLLESYKDERQKFYLEVFDMWSKVNKDKIEKSTFPDWVRINKQ